MRLLLPLMMVGVLGFCIFIIGSGSVSGKAADKAMRLLQAIHSGNKGQAIAEFGDNSCDCAPPGGYESYLRYNRGNEPNLAFLLGQQFTIGQPSSTSLPVKQAGYVMPWEKQEEEIVLIPVSFDDAKNSPYFLPLDMAFGYEMPESKLNAFLDDPEKGWLRGFTMRLRNSLAKGVIEPDVRLVDEVQELRRKELEKQLPPEVLKYFKPADAAEVKLASGQVVTAGSLAAELPRLKSIVVGVKVVRRGAMYPWAVKKIGVQDAVILSRNKEFVLKESSPTARIAS